MLKNKIIYFPAALYYYGPDIYKLILAYLGYADGGTVHVRKYGTIRFKDRSVFSMINEIIIRHEYDKIPLSKSDVVLDLGMNVGVYSIYVINKYGSKIIGVEANPAIFNIARSNLLPYKKNIIDLINKAVWKNDDETIKISICRESGVSSVYKDWGGSERISYVNIKTISFHRLLNKYKPTVIKCDIEGAEWEIFDKETFYLLEHSKVRYITMEVHAVDDKFTKRTKHLCDGLSKSGFDVQVQQGNEKTAMVFGYR